MNCVVTPYGCLNMVCLITCFIFFFFQAKTFFELYLESATVMGSTYMERERKALPSITLCPEDVLKIKGGPVTSKEFEKMSYKMVNDS